MNQKLFEKASCFMESEHLQNIDVSWGHEPKVRKALEIKECMFRFLESRYGVPALAGGIVATQAGSQNFLGHSLDTSRRLKAGLHTA
jgi:hypothetical protein